MPETSSSPALATSTAELMAMCTREDTIRVVPPDQRLGWLRGLSMIFTGLIGGAEAVASLEAIGVELNQAMAAGRVSTEPIASCLDAVRQQAVYGRAIPAGAALSNPREERLIDDLQILPERPSDRPADQLEEAWEQIKERTMAPTDSFTFGRLGLPPGVEGFMDGGVTAFVMGQLLGMEFFAAIMGPAADQQHMYEALMDEYNLLPTFWTLMETYHFARHLSPSARGANPVSHAEVLRRLQR